RGACACGPGRARALRSLPTRRSSDLGSASAGRALASSALSERPRRTAARTRAAATRTATPGEGARIGLALCRAARQVAPGVEVVRRGDHLAAGALQAADAQCAAAAGHVDAPASRVQHGA